MKTLLMIVMILVVGLNANAQNTITVQNNELLIYTKVINEQKRVVIQTGHEITYYPLESSECIAPSPDSRYIALSQEQPTTLKIVHLQSQNIVFETTWLPAWTACSMRWSKNNILLIYSQGMTNVFKFENRTLTPSSLPEIVYPSLPYFTPTLEPGGIRSFYLQNPANPNIYLYHKCFIEAMLGYACPYNGVVIYDLNTNAEVEQVSISLTDVQGFNVEINGSQFTRYRVSFDIVGWAPNGRYLAFFDNIDMVKNVGQIIIYDLQEDRYIEDRDNLYPFNFNQRILWSNSDILLIWKTGLFLAEQSDYNDSLAQFVFYNPHTQTSVNSIDVFNVLRSEAVFSPDSNGLLIVGKPVIGYDYPVFSTNPTRADLILISTTTGESTVIDTDVTEIITWRSICDFTPTDTASLISTMQTEPYSVICLDENGQYDLTAPLPDVAGDITIIGNGATITMTAEGRVFNVLYNEQWSRDGSLTLKDVTISGGNAVQGGAIFNAGTLVLENALLENNSADEGGAIYNTGTLTMDGGTLQNNSAEILGGAIYNAGTIALDDVNIQDNDAPDGSAVYQAPTP